MNNLYADMLKQPHLLIAGATGSGKSVLENGLIYSLMERPPFDQPGGAKLILIDPKRVELVQYRSLPNTIRYASEPDDMIDALNLAMVWVNDRYQEMQRDGLRMYNGGDIYVFIDELADLMTTNGKEVQPLIQRIAQVGRAARVHLICCTQCPLAKVIPTPIKVNFDARVGLRTRSAQDSRNILERTGCEKLPRYGQGYYMTAEGTKLWQIPYYPDEQIFRRIRQWKDWERQLDEAFPELDELRARVRKLQEDCGEVHNGGSYTPKRSQSKRTFSGFLRSVFA